MNPYLNIDLGISQRVSMYRALVLECPWPEIGPMSSEKPILEMRLVDFVWVADFDVLGIAQITGWVEFLLNKEPLDGACIQVASGLYNDHGIIKYDKTPRAYETRGNFYWVFLWLNNIGEKPVRMAKYFWTKTFRPSKLPDPPDHILWHLLLYSSPKTFTVFPPSKDDVPYPISYSLTKQLMGITFGFAFFGDNVMEDVLIAADEPRFKNRIFRSAKEAADALTSNPSDQKRLQDELTEILIELAEDIEQS